MSTIVYFSGTGNCYHVAKLISGHMKSNLIDMSEYDDVSIHDDTIGIITPVYCGELPKNVKDFLKKVILRSDYIWAIAVSGGTVGTTLFTIDKLLKYNDLKLSYGNYFTMPDNSIMTRPKPEDTKAALDAEIDNIARAITDISAKKTNKYPIQRFLGYTSKPQWFALKRFFRVNKKKANPKLCTKCQTCIKVCPTNNISINKKNNISFGKECINCFACLHWCPEGALSAGLVKAPKEKQYTHPDVKLSEMVKR